MSYNAFIYGGYFIIIGGVAYVRAEEVGLGVEFGGGGEVRELELYVYH
jgi:hypothetical protein